MEENIIVYWRKDGLGYWKIKGKELIVEPLNTSMYYFLTKKNKFRAALT